MMAKEYFEGIRTEVVRIAQSRDMLERLRAREGAKTQNLAGGGGPGLHDPMDAIARRIDFEGRLVTRIKDLQREVDRALTVLYGDDGRGGLAAAKGTRYADALCMYYLQAETWADIADVMSCTPQWCRELCNAAFAYIDKVGFAYLRNVG